jgi:hypothetical protein
LDILEIALEDVDEGVEEGEDEYCIIVFSGDCNEVEIVVLVEVEEIIIFALDDGSVSRKGYLRVYSSYSRIFLLKTS